MTRRDSYIKIGDLARASGLSERALRHYEQLGIIRPDRTEGGTRAYAERDLALAGLIGKMRDAGIPLDRVSRIATARAKHDSGAASSREVREELSALSADLLALARLAIELEAEVTKVSLAIGDCLNCENRPSAIGCPSCAMNALSESSPLADMIWRD